ncbi:MAG TPA: prepilin-type N-terminal cleavage/methylation domain-containing protein [Longimicrobiales bacterium]|nr:prepilin-type N-terminal cleavage/methylation domain-containing protein [Longimicrobiales bacterium]
MSMMPRSHREGMTIVELLVAMVVAAVILQAGVSLFIGQSQLVGETESQRSARYISRTGADVFMADLRRVETGLGVVSASASKVDLLVPFALGIVCTSTSAATTLSLLPTDSVRLAGATTDGFAAYARRSSSGAYAGYKAVTDFKPGSASDCTGASVTVFEAQYARLVEPGLGSVAAGTPALLYDRISYEFKDEGDGLFLFRTVNGEPEEALVGPFDPDNTAFRFYAAGSATSSASPPGNLQDVRGLELVLQGLGTRPEEATGEVSKAPLTTSVFFKNTP